METASTFRERAGVFVSGMVVAALILVGPSQMLAQIMTGQALKFDETWVATIAGLAGTAFGFLIGKQTTNGPSVTASLGNDAGSASATVTGAADKTPVV